MRSDDGGETFTEPEQIGEAIVGPGHGIQIQMGMNAGRLVVPAHSEGQSRVFWSDDQGESWQLSSTAGNGNESEVAELPDGRLIMVVRTNHSVAKPHDPLNALFSFSGDGGETWTEAAERGDVPTPICMASLVMGEDGLLYYSTPHDFYSRAKMTLFRSPVDELSWESAAMIYAGPAGYSDLGVLSTGDLLLLFENGAVEYDERLTLVKITP
jgi:sialidase-1